LTQAPYQEAKMTPALSSKTFVFLVVLVGVAFSSISYAMAASNAANPNPAGNGISGISGYVITNVKYTLGDDPTTVDSVAFTLSAPATRVNIRLSDSQSNWYGCSEVGGNEWNCNAENALLRSVNELQVIASGN
jgi:hypothetical protein